MAKPSQLMYERIKQLGYVQPDEIGLVKATPAHLELRYFAYKAFAIAALVWSIAAFN